MGDNMERAEVEEAIEKDLNSDKLKNKFIEMGKEKGYLYSDITFANVRIQDEKVIIDIIAGKI